MAHRLNPPCADARESPPPVLSLVAIVSLAGLVYVWVAYPLFIGSIAALIRRRASPGAAPPRTPTVSVIIASRDDAPTIERRVADLRRTTYPRARMEIVVAVDYCSDAALPAIEGDAEALVVVRGDSPGGKAATLNAAVRAARGEVLVFADAHQRFEPDAIGQLVAALDTPGVGAASGCLDIPTRDGARSLAERYWLMERWLRRNEAEVHSCVGVTGAIWALRRELWSALPARLILDDLYTPLRLVLGGHRVAFVHEARATETRRHLPREEYHRKVRTLTGVVQICAWMPEALDPLRNPLWLQWVTHKLLRLLTPYWLAAIGLWVAVQAGTVLGAKALWILGLGFVAAVCTRVVQPRIAALAWETVVSGALLQSAAIVGTVNGIRRRWDVWRA